MMALAISVVDLGIGSKRTTGERTTKKMTLYVYRKPQYEPKFEGNNYNQSEGQGCDVKGMVWIP